jgi:hypothetical protein
LEELIAYFPINDTDHVENDASNNSSIVAYVFVAAVTFPPSRCLATIGGYTCTHIHRQQPDLISLLYFFKIRKVGLKTEAKCFFIHSFPAIN